MAQSTAAATSMPADGSALKRSLGLPTAVTLIVGTMIGSGIFIAPSIMAANILSPGVYLAVWVFGGALALLGALCYGELAAMLPAAGGQYIYLRQAFGAIPSYLYGWAFFTIIQAGSNAAVGLAFAKYLGVLGLPVGEQIVLLDLGFWQLSTAQVVAVLTIAFLTWINVRGVESGAMVQNVFTGLKAGAIIALVVVAYASVKGTFANFTPMFHTEVGTLAKAAGTTFMAAVALAVSKALFAYDAWNTATFVAEEIDQPQRNLPRALLWGTLATTALYLAIASAYLYVLPMADMGAVKENRVAAEVASTVLGTAGLVGVSLAILASTFGCLNGLILSGGRVLYAMAKDGVFFASSGEIHQKHRTPARALWLLGGWSILLALSGSYGTLLDYVTFASIGFNALVVVGLFVLRKKMPDAERPYRVWGYPLTPIAFLLGSGLFLVYIFQGAPGQALGGLGLVATGVLFLPLFRRGAAAKAPTAT